MREKINMSLVAQLESKEKQIERGISDGFESQSKSDMPFIQKDKHLKTKESID